MHACCSLGYKLFLSKGFFSPSDSVSPTHPLEKGPLPEGSLAKGKMDTPLPQGCSGYQEGMVLNKDSPSWLWKSLRKHLAKGDNKNKAGKKLGAGTTSLTRKEKRRHLQPENRAESNGPTYDWDQWNSWERGWDDDGSQWHSWGWTAQDWSGGSWHQPRRRNQSRSSSRSRSQRSQSPLQRGKVRLQSAERGASGSESDDSMSGRSPSPSPSCSSSSCNYRPPLRKGSKEWKVREAARQQWHDKSLQDTPTIAEEPAAEGAKDVPVEKGAAEKAPWEKGAQEKAPVEKGAEEKAKEKQPLEKGQQEKGAIKIEVKKEQPEEKAPAKNDAETNVPLKKGPKEQTPLKKGDGAASSSSAAATSSSSAAPAKSQPHVMVDYHNVLSLDDYISPQRSAAMVKLLDAGVKVTVCSWCYRNRAAKVMGHMRRQPWFGRLEACFTTEHRTGPTGKSGICKERGCQAIMDDSGDILEAALEEGIEIFPISTSRTRHGWWLKGGGRIFDSFEHAVEEYLLYQEEEK